MPIKRKRECPCNKADWKDIGTDSRGYIKTACCKCNRFIGYRDPDKKRRKSNGEKLIRQDEATEEDK